MSTYVGNVDLAKLGVGPGDRVIDLGCGEGVLAEMLARAGLHVTGIEPAAYLRERFAARVGAVDPESAVVDGLADRLPFGDGEAGAVVTTEVLEHVPDPEAALRELHRAMRPGAMLCLSVPTSFTELLFWRLHPRYAENATHLRIFTKPELRRLLDVTGFDVEAWEGRNFYAALLWTFHALLRTPSDHTGQILGNAWMTRIVDAGWRALQIVGLDGLAERAGNRVWPKSWYVYCRRR
jgi:SAM-dependent methyltransferase